MSYSSSSSSSDESDYSALSNISDLDSNDSVSLHDGSQISDDLAAENDLTTEVKRTITINKNAGAANVAGDKPKKVILEHFVNQNNESDSKLILKAAMERGCSYSKK